MLNHLYMRRFLPILSVFLFLLSCDSTDVKNQPQGVIEYSVAYISNKSSIPTNLLPKKVTLKFKAHKSITTIDGFMGMFCFSNICDFKKLTNTMILKVMDNKYYYPGSKYEPPFFFDGLKDVNIELKNEPRLIAGLICKKAIISYKNNSKPSFEVYYTDQIRIKNPNKSNPLNQLNGVLIQFNISMNTIEMHLMATKYKNDIISDELFKIPKEYRKVSKEKMSGVLAKLLE
jgi:hypothetical protein